MLLNKGMLKVASSTLAKQEVALHKVHDVAQHLNVTVQKQRAELHAEVKLGTAFQLQAEKAYNAQGRYLRGQVSFYKGEVADTRKHYRHSVLVAVAYNAQGGMPLRSLMVRPSIAMIRVLPIASSLQFLC
jgi:hypothetical protein